MSQFVIGMVWHPAAWKSTLAKELVNSLGFSHINKDKIRIFLRDNIKYFEWADHSYSNTKIASVNRVVKPSSNFLIEELLKEWQNIIIDWYWKTRQKRDEYKKLLKKYNIKLIILYVKEEKNIILERLKERDKNQKTKWVENFLNKWYPEFDPPLKNESDYLMEVSSSNKEESIKNLKKIISK